MELKANPLHLYYSLFKIAIHDIVTQACMHVIVLDLKKKKSVIRPLTLKNILSITVLRVMIFNSDVH